MCWRAPPSVVTSVPPERFCTTPPAIRTIAATTLIGSRTRSVIRVRSTQKLPSWSVLRRANPRTSATATAMPTAAETKFCTARPAICTRWPIVDSPEYHCQLVFVTNDTAVFQAPWVITPGKPRDSGRKACSRRNAYRNRMLTAENASTLRAYTPQDCSDRRVDPDQPVDAPLDPGVGGAGHHPVHVVAQKSVCHRQGGDQRQQEEDARGGRAHQNRSGNSRAATRNSAMPAAMIKPIRLTAFTAVPPPSPPGRGRRTAPPSTARMPGQPPCDSFSLRVLISTA